MSSEEPGSGGIRAARGLRQAPPQRTPFNPDTGPAFRHRSNFNNPSPQPSTSSAGGNHSINSSSNPNSAYFVASNYEPRPQVPISTREVITPGNRPISFARLHESPAPTETQDPIRHLEIGRNTGIYMRILNGLHSRIPAEQDFALHHLVKISCERGDKYKFEGFPGLAEGLIDKALEITLLCTGTHWEIDYDSRGPPEKTNALNAMFGTPDVLSRLEKFPITLPDDSLEDDVFAHHLRQINEATLVLRNMVILKENAIFLSQEIPLFRDWVAIGLNVPNQPRFNEIRNYTLDMAEHLTRHWDSTPEDPVFVSLLKCLDSPDRYHNLTALHAINRFSIEQEESTRFQSFPVSKMAHILNWTYLELDKDMLGAVLDFLYQYTALQENIEDLLKNFQLQITLIPRLVSLLSFECKHVQETHVRQEEKRAPAPTDIPAVPSDIVVELLKFSEPERSSRWLRSCFVEDDECEVTQIALWQAYQSHFADARGVAGTMLPAAEFIKNVTSTFTRAQAQVIHEPSAKFIIKGIRPLEIAHTIDGYPYLPCEWDNPKNPGGLCGTMFPTATKLQDHIFGEHLELERSPSGDWNWWKTKSSFITCRWNGCNRFPKSGVTESARVVTGHVTGHYPGNRDETKPPPVPGRKILQPQVSVTFDFYDTPVNEKGEPSGIAYNASLILRNIIRNLPKELSGPKHGNLPWNTVLFFSSRRKLFELLDQNRSLRIQISDIACAIE